MQRWLALTLGLGIAAAAAYALLTAQRAEPRPQVPPDSASLDEIDAESRARLGAILREEDEGAGTAARPDGESSR